MPRSPPGPYRRIDRPDFEFIGPEEIEIDIRFTYTSGDCSIPKVPKLKANFSDVDTLQKLWDYIGRSHQAEVLDRIYGCQISPKVVRLVVKNAGHKAVDCVDAELNWLEKNKYDDWVRSSLNTREKRFDPTIMIRMPQSRI